MSGFFYFAYISKKLKYKQSKNVLSNKTQICRNINFILLPIFLEIDLTSDEVKLINLI